MMRHRLNIALSLLALALTVTLSYRFATINIHDNNMRQTNNIAITYLIDASSNGKFFLSVSGVTELPQGTASYVIGHPDHTSYHLLLLMRQLDLPTYRSVGADIRARILCSTLQKCKLMNDWGVLDPESCYDGIAAMAILELGVNALPYLKPILDDERRALLFGSEEAGFAFDCGYERADFAFRYISLITRRPYVFNEDVTIRRHLIDGMKLELAENEGVQDLRK